QWLAYALPCRRFASALAGSDARLGASVDRYSFTAVDLHHLLLAGLPAHEKRNHRDDPSPISSESLQARRRVLARALAAVNHEVGRLVGAVFKPAPGDRCCVRPSRKFLLHLPHPVELRSATLPAARGGITTSRREQFAMPLRLSRRALVKGAAGSALIAGIGAPAIVRAQADAIRIGHLTPLTGFLGPLGEYAVMGVKLAAEEINNAGGVMGRKIELVMEDSVNPQTASAKAERLIERDKVAMIIGEISSASGLAIGQVANRLKTVFINTGCNSDALRGASCNPYMFHIEGANSMYVMAVGQYLLRENLVRGKKWYSLTADYAFGHDLLRVAKKFMEA